MNRRESLRERGEFVTDPNPLARTRSLELRLGQAEPSGLIRARSSDSRGSSVFPAARSGFDMGRSLGFQDAGFDLGGSWGEAGGGGLEGGQAAASPEKKAGRAARRPAPVDAWAEMVPAAPAALAAPRAQSGGAGGSFFAKTRSGLKSRSRSIKKLRSKFGRRSSSKSLAAEAYEYNGLLDGNDSDDGVVCTVYPEAKSPRGGYSDSDSGDLTELTATDMSITPDRSVFSRSSMTPDRPVYSRNYAPSDGDGIARSPLQQLQDAERERELLNSRVQEIRQKEPTPVRKGGEQQLRAVGVPPSIGDARGSDKGAQGPAEPPKIWRNGTDVDSVISSNVSTTASAATEKRRNYRNRTFLTQPAHPIPTQLAVEAGSLEATRESGAVITEASVEIDEQACLDVLEALNAFKQKGKLVRVVIRSSEEEVTEFILPCSMIAEREEEMFAAVTNGNVATKVEKWSGSMLGRRLRDALALHSDERVFNFHLDPQKECIEAGITNGRYKLKWNPILTECIRSYYNTGSVSILDTCKCNGLLYALEYFGVCTSPKKLSFDSFGSYMRFKIWSDYFNVRRDLVYWIIKMIMSSSSKMIHAFVTCPNIIEGPFYDGTRMLDVFDGGLGENGALVHNGVIIKSYAIIHDLFNAAGGEEEATDGSVTNASSATTAFEDSLIRHDFCSFLEKYLPGTDISFSLREITVGSPEVPSKTRAVRAVLRVDSSGRGKKKNKSKHVSETKAAEKPTFDSGWVNFASNFWPSEHSDPMSDLTSNDFVDNAPIQAERPKTPLESLSNELVSGFFNLGNCGTNIDLLANDTD